MSCLPTQSSAPQEIDIPVLREKYRHGRDKRIFREATNQYERPTGDFADTYRGDPHMLYAGETYGPGWVAFEQLLKEWRDSTKLEGLVLTGTTGT
jgi:hypothetical protein